MYLATVPDILAKKGFKEVWTFFSDLPVGSSVTDGSSVCFFPSKVISACQSAPPFGGKDTGRRMIQLFRSF